MRLLAILLLATQLTLGQTSQVKLFNFQNSTCDQESDPARLRTRIISQSFSKDILTIQLATTATCCVTFLPRTSYKSGVLDLDFVETGTPCECSCCYEFTYEMKGITDDKPKITFKGKEIEQSTEKYITYPVSFQLLDGDTINLVDKYGLKQGIWFLPTDPLLRTRYLEYVDNSVVRLAYLYPGGQIEKELIREKTSFQADNKMHFDYADYNKLVEYFKSGQKKRECYNERKELHNSYERGKCKEWNDKGELIYQGEYRK